MKIQYRDQEIDVQSGDIVLFRNEFVWNEPMTWLSTAIRLFTKCEYNHCAIAVNDWDVLMLNESLWDGVISRPMELHLSRIHSRIAIIRKTNRPPERDLCVRANSKLGIPYAYDALIIYQVLYRVFGIWIGKKRREAMKSMVCSEYCAWVHGLKKWWLYSAKELMKEPGFEMVYKEE
jgi:hypothetical protein